MYSKKLTIDTIDKRISVVNNTTQDLENLEEGFYSVKYDYGFMSKIPYLAKDESSKFIPTNILENELFSKIKTQFSTLSQNIHSSLEFKLKVGVLLYGKYGCGKTTLCYQIADYFNTYMQAITIVVFDFSQLNYAVDFSKSIRTYVGFNKPVVIIFDECEHHMSNYESEIKGILDSNESLENCLFLFTTNYENIVPEAIKLRPSRIKYFHELKGESDDIRIYNVIKSLNDKLDEDLKLTDETLGKLVAEILEKNKEATIDEIKHVFIDKLIAINPRKKIVK